MKSIRRLLLEDLDVPLATVRVEPVLERLNGERLIVRGRRRYAPEGRILGTSYYGELRPNLRQVLAHLLLPGARVMRRSDITGTLTPEEYEAQGAADQDASVREAAYAASVFLGLTPTLDGEGVKVESVAPGGPCDGLLSPGDVIVQAGGIRVTKAEELYAQMVRSKGELALEVLLAQRDGLGESVRNLVVPVAARDGRPALGVKASTYRLRVNLPIDVELERTAGGAGPSMGLALALSMLDVLTPGELSGGTQVAVTGTIDGAGRVHGVGGVALKAAAVKQFPEVDLFLVPEENAAEAQSVKGSAQVVGVSSLREAVEVLCRRGGEKPSLPRT